MNKKVAASAIAVALICAGGIFAHQSSYFQESTQAYPLAAMSGDLAEVFHTVDELEHGSGLIVEADVTGGEALEYNHVVFTVNQVRVSKVLKGELPGKANIRIVETGGVYNNTEYVFENNPVLQPGEKGILFLEPYIGPVADDAYVIKGAYQGKFVFADGKMQTFKPPVEKYGELQNVRSVDDLKLAALP